MSLTLENVMSPKTKPVLLKTELTTPESTILHRIYDAASCLLEDEPALYARVRGHLRSRSWGSLLTVADTLAADAYASPDMHYRRNQFAALVRKYPFSSKLVPGINRRQAAVRKFTQSEQRCARVNKHIARREIMYKGASRRPYHDVIRKARAYIERVLGKSPRVARIYEQCGFSGGANMGIRSDLSNVYRKVTAPRFTATALSVGHFIRASFCDPQLRRVLVPELYNTASGMYCYDLERYADRILKRTDIVEHNNVTFVPKSAKTDRSIAVEPLLNGYVQKGVDLEMRYLLKTRAGIDLQDQTVNQQWAFQGSAGWLDKDPYVTLDLSSASDSVSTELVRLLLPREWFRILEDCRSASYKLDGVVKRYHKFSSMGNGTNFPLQTLLYASLAYATGGTRDFTVYGDDIIVRRSGSASLIEVLTHFGFVLNTDKTFIFGPFRESCGADWHTGQDVRPVVWDAVVADVRQLYALHNAFWRSKTCATVTRVMEAVRSLAPRELQFLRPGRDPGDTCFSVPLDTFMASPRCISRPDTQSFAWQEVISRAVRDPAMGHIERSRWGTTAAFVWNYAILRGSRPQEAFSVRFRSIPTLTLVERAWSDDYHGTEGPVYLRKRIEKSLRIS